MMLARSLSRFSQRTTVKESCCSSVMTTRHGGIMVVFDRDYASNSSTRALSTIVNRSFSTKTRAASPARQFSSIGAQWKENEFIQKAKESGYDMFEASLTVGADDRSIINTETGTNIYHTRPHPMDSNAIFRGSCTCNSPTEQGYKGARKVYAEFEYSTDLERTLQSVFDDQRRRIAECLGLPEGVEVVLCPSGTDAEYIPIAMARALNPAGTKKMVSIVTQFKEIGIGSAAASGGEWFSTHAPLTGRIPDGMKKLDGFQDITEISIPARDLNGSVLDASTLAAEAAHKAEIDGAYTIIHGVFGGKTGIRDDVMPPSKDGGKTSMGVIDACQGRFSQAELHQWLEQDSVVLFTASKFYQAPPFCGAVLIPKRMAEQLRKLPPPEPKSMFDKLGLPAFLTDKELPDCLESWKPLLRSENSDNIGLALRWEAGLVGMEALAATPDEERTQAVEEWATQVVGMIAARPELDAWCVERSIISIMLRHSGNGSLFDMDELRDVYRYMSIDVSSAVPRSASAVEKAALAVACNLGQPVDVAESYAILRIALGSESLSGYLKDPDSILKEDLVAVQKLALVAKYFVALKNSKF